MADSQTGISGVGDNYEDEFFGLNGFKKKYFDERIIDSYFSEIKTVASIENTPYEFMFTVPDDCFLEQSETLLEGEFKVLKSDGTKVGDNDEISLCNLPSAAIFEQIECKINDENCSDVSRKLYPFKAHVVSELSYSKGAKTSVLRPSLYLHEPNTADSNDSSTADGNEYLKIRRNWAKGSKRIRFSTKIYLDIFHTEKQVPPSSKLYLKLIKNNDEFTLIQKDAANTYKISMINLKLVLKLNKPHEKFLKYFRNSIQRENYVIPCTNTMVKSFVCKSGETSIHIPNINTEKYLPRQVIACFVNRNAFNGEKTKNPFIYKPYDLKRMEIKLDSGKIFKLQRENESLNLSSITHSGTECYQKFLDGIGFSRNTSDIGITFEKFISESFFGVFNFSDFDNCNGYHLHKPLFGSYSFFTEFNKALENDIEIVLFNVFQASFTIDQRNKGTFYNHPIPPPRSAKDNSFVKIV